MSKFLTYILGIITGTILTIGAGYIYINRDDKDELPGLTLFDKEGDCVSKYKDIEVMQVVRANAALAHIREKNFDRLLVMIINYDGFTYYDDQKLTIPKNKCAKQIGTYSYESKMEVLKTVPVVIIE